MRNFLLIPWIVLFSLIILSGSYRYYIASFQLWTCVTGLALMTVFFLYDIIIPLPPEEEHHAHDHNHSSECCSDSHCHHHGSTDKPLGFKNGLIHILPLFLFMITGPKELTVQMASAKDPFAGYRNMEEGTGSVLEGIEEIDPDSYDLSTFKTADLQKLYTDPVYRQGHHGVIVEGLVYKPPADEIPRQLQDGTQKLLLLHFVMVCCAADCTPKVVLLRGISPEELTENTWVRVWGVSSHIGEGTNAEIMMLTILQHQKLARPTYPYLMP